MALDKIMINIEEKLKAFSIHLTISAIIALVSLALVYLIWNPAPLYKATGITKIFMLMLGIDLTLGPLLTFIVYKKGKKTLKMDLVVIVILQLSALIYGLWHVYEGRPVWIVYNVDRFDLVRINEIDTRKLNQAKPDYQSPSTTQPRYVTAIVPREDIKEKNRIMFEEVFSGVAPSQRPELYQAIDKAYPQILKRAQPLSELNKYNDPTTVKATLTKYPIADSFVPLKANAVDMTVLIDKKAGGKIVKIVDLRPWK